MPRCYNRIRDLRSVNQEGSLMKYMRRNLMGEAKDVAYDFIIKSRSDLR